MNPSPESVKISQSLQALGQGLDEVIEGIAGKRVAFTLIIFTDGRANYLSSCSREESVREIKNLLALWESGMPDIPAHEVCG